MIRRAARGGLLEFRFRNGRVAILSMDAGVRVYDTRGVFVAPESQPTRLGTRDGGADAVVAILHEAAGAPPPETPEARAHALAAEVLDMFVATAGDGFAMEAAPPGSEGPLPAAEAERVREALLAIRDSHKRTAGARWKEG